MKRKNLISIILICILAAGFFVRHSEAYYIKLAWDPSISEGEIGYIVYYDTISQCSNTIDVGNATTAIIDDLTLDTWYFMATAYYVGGYESGYSNQISNTFVDADLDGVEDFYDTCSNDLPIKISGLPLYFTNLQDAYDTAVDSEAILSHDIMLSGYLIADHNKTISLEGGYDCGYIDNEGRTTIYGDMEIIDGTIIIENGTFEIK